MGIANESVNVLVTGTNPERTKSASEEVVDAIVFLASDRATFITGQVISVNGGSTM